ncbi:unnamed protein product [Phytomonas sp. Hart1]|nr:unnamed protein product [Phytomonas sp. Hart1]|eukprot:CCW67709.1 unnamed protein product [Phytomonas sp. isolate Hart1]
MKFRNIKSAVFTPSPGSRLENTDAAPGVYSSSSTKNTVGSSSSGQSSSTPLKNILVKQKRNDWYYISYACLAGACGALSAVVGKLAVTSTNAPELANHTLKTLDYYHAYLPIPGVSSVIMSKWMVSALPLVFRSIFLITNVVLTGQMWCFYLKALSVGPTPVCQILNTGTNFAVSAFVGIFFFLEEVNVMWVCGALMVFVGLALIVMDPSASPAK